MSNLQRPPPHTPPQGWPGRQPPGWTPFIQPPHTPPQGWPGQQPQGWPGQQPGFNLQEATGALDTAQGLLGDASSEITAADMEPLSNARGMVSQAQNALVQGFGPPRQQNPWGGRQGTMPGILGMLGGIGPQAIAGAPQGGGPQTLGSLGTGLLGGPSSSGGMLPAFMANGGPAETTGIGPLYMQGGGLMDHIDSLSTADVAKGVAGLGLSLADLAGGFGKLGGMSTGIGALTGLISAYRSGDLRDVLPFKIGHLIGRMFGYDPEGDRAKIEGPSWAKSTTLTGPQVNRGSLAHALYPAPGTRALGPGENPFSGMTPAIDPDPTEDAAPGEGPDAGDAGFDYGGTGFDGGGYGSWMRDGGLVKRQGYANGGPVAQPIPRKEWDDMRTAIESWVLRHKGYAEDDIIPSMAGTGDEGFVPDPSIFGRGPPIKKGGNVFGFETSQDLLRGIIDRGAEPTMAELDLLRQKEEREKWGDETKKPQSSLTPLEFSPKKIREEVQRTKIDPETKLLVEKYDFDQLRTLYTAVMKPEEGDSYSLPNLTKFWDNMGMSEEERRTWLADGIASDLLGHPTLELQETPEV